MILNKNRVKRSLLLVLGALLVTGAGCVNVKQDPTDDPFVRIFRNKQYETLANLDRDRKINEAGGVAEPMAGSPVREQFDRSMGSIQNAPIVSDEESRAIRQTLLDMTAVAAAAAANAAVKSQTGGLGGF